MIWKQFLYWSHPFVKYLTMCSLFIGVSLKMNLFIYLCVDGVLCFVPKVKIIAAPLQEVGCSATPFFLFLRSALLAVQFGRYNLSKNSRYQSSGMPTDAKRVAILVRPEAAMHVRSSNEWRRPSWTPVCCGNSHCGRSHTRVGVSPLFSYLPQKHTDQMTVEELFPVPSCLIVCFSCLSVFGSRWSKASHRS
jgi:hypothetical protein